MQRDRETKARRTVHDVSLQSLFPLIAERATVTIDGKAYDYRAWFSRVSAPLRAPYTTSLPACVCIYVCSKSRVPM